MTSVHITNAYHPTSGGVRTFTRWYLRHIYGPPFDAHIAISDDTADELRPALPDRAPGFSRLCPTGVQTDGFGPHHGNASIRESMLRRCGGTPGSVLLSYAGPSRRRRTSGCWSRHCGCSREMVTATTG